MYLRNNIIMECFHGLADGAGAIEFLKTMVYEYFLLKGYPMESEGMVMDAEDHASQNEIENSFLKYYDNKGDYTKLKQPIAYHIMGTPMDPNEIFVTHGIMNLKKFLAHVKSSGVTVSAYVASLLIYCIASTQAEYAGSKKPIIVSVPVDLRSMFPSGTLRNFVSFANVGMAVKKDTSFSDILQSVSIQLKEGLKKEKIHANINKNVKFEKNPFIRITPLFVKNMVVSNTYRLYGEGSYTMLLSNLKTTHMPGSMRKYIKNIYYTLGVSDLNPLNCVIVSYEGNMIITFARGIEETDIIRKFFRHFSEEVGLEIELRGNEWKKRV